MNPVVFAMVDAWLSHWEWECWLHAAYQEGEHGYAAVAHLYANAQRRCDQLGWWRSTWGE